MKKLITILLTTTLLVSQGSSSVFADNDPPLRGKTWLQEVPPNQILYGQPYLNSAAYKKMTKEQKEQYKINYFMRKKMIPLNQKLAYTVSFLISLPIVIGGCILFAKYQYNARPPLLQPQAPQAPQAPQVVPEFDIGRLMLASFVSLSPIFIPAYGFWGHTAWKAVENRFINRIDDPVEFLEKEYIKRKEFLSPGVTSEIEKQFSISRTVPTRLNQVINFAETALKMPMTNTKIDFISNKIDRIFSGYESELKAQVKAFALRQVMMQQVAENNVQPFREGKRIAAYFQGLPGSGKTRFAELTAQSLGLPFARISLEGATINDLIGRNLNTGDPSSGLIVQAMTNAQVNGQTAKNTVLFIDEADRVINNSKSEILPFLLKLLDPESKTFFNPYLNTDVDISNLTIILAGNYDIQDEALRKRLQVINFKGFTPEFKKQIIWENTLNKMCISYSKNGKYSISLADFTEHDKAIINKLIELDQDAGFRTIESVLMDYLDYKVMTKYFDEKTPFPNLVEKINLSNLEQQKKTAASTAA